MMNPLLSPSNAFELFLRGIVRSGQLIITLCSIRKASAIIAVKSHRFLALLECTLLCFPFEQQVVADDVEWSQTVDAE